MSKQTLNLENGRASGGSDPQRPGVPAGAGLRGGLIHREDAAGSEDSTQGPKWGAPIFLRGTIAAVECSDEPSAILTVPSGYKTTKLKIADKHHLILIGTDQFSCSWTNKKAAVNYRQSESGDTNVMSLELQ